MQAEGPVAAALVPLPLLLVEPADVEVVDHEQVGRVHDGAAHLVPPPGYVHSGRQAVSEKKLSRQTRTKLI